MFVFEAKDGSGDIEGARFFTIDEAIEWARIKGVPSNLFNIAEIPDDGSVFEAASAEDRQRAVSKALSEYVDPAYTSDGVFIPEHLREGYVAPEEVKTKEEVLKGAGVEARTEALAPRVEDPTTRSVFTQAFPYMAARAGAGEEVSVSDPGTWRAATRDVLSAPGRFIFGSADEGVGTTKEDPSESVLGKVRSVGRDPAVAAGALAAPIFAPVATASVPGALAAGAGEGAVVAGFEGLTDPSYSMDDAILEVLLSMGTAGLLSGGTKLIKNRIKSVLGDRYTEELADRLIPRLKASVKGTKKSVKEGAEEEVGKLTDFYRSQEPPPATVSDIVAGKKGVSEFPRDLPIEGGELPGVNIFDLGASKKGIEDGRLLRPRGTSDYRRTFGNLLDRWKTSVELRDMPYKDYLAKEAKLGEFINKVERYKDLRGVDNLTNDDVVRLSEEFAGEYPEIVAEFVNETAAGLPKEAAMASPFSTENLRAYQSYLDSPAPKSEITNVDVFRPIRSVGDILGDPYRMRWLQSLLEGAQPVAPIATGRAVNVFGTQER